LKEVVSQIVGMVLDLIRIGTLDCLDYFQMELLTPRN